jgi:hypothetical protein
VRGTPLETFDLKRGRARSIVFAISFQPIISQIFRLFLPFPLSLYNVPSFNESTIESILILFVPPEPKVNPNWRSGESEEVRGFMSKLNATPLIAMSRNATSTPLGTITQGEVCALTTFSFQLVTIQGSRFSFSFSFGKTPDSERYGRRFSIQHLEEVVYVCHVQISPTSLKFFSAKRGAFVVLDLKNLPIPSTTTFTNSEEHTSMKS